MRACYLRSASSYTVSRFCQSHTSIAWVERQVLVQAGQQLTIDDKCRRRACTLCDTRRGPRQVLRCTLVAAHMTRLAEGTEGHTCVCVVRR